MLSANGMSRTAIGVALVTGAAVAWSLTGLFVRALDLPSATLLVWRGLFGCIALLVVILALKGPAGFGDFLRLGRGGWLYAVTSGVGMLCFVTSMNTTSVAHVVVIYATVPFMAAGLAWLILGERPGRHALIACAMALVGAMIMAGWSNDGTAYGDFLALVMTILMAVMIIIARWDPNIPTLAAAAVSTLLGASAAFPFAPTLDVTGTQMLLLAAFGTVNSAFGIALFILGSALLPPVKSALISVLDTPLGPLWVWLVFSETPSGPTILGGAIVMAAAVWYIRRDAHPA